MPLPWLQDVDPAERLPDETEWEDHDEFTLWKQCKLRGIEHKVKKDGDALRFLNEFKEHLRFEVTWICSFHVECAAYTCIHILYLELYVLKCPRRLPKKDFWHRDELVEYFVNAPPAFKPWRYVKAQDADSEVSDTDCQLCFKKVMVTGEITRCQVCRRVAHQQCHAIYRARKGACEGSTGCPLCCPQCPWNPSKPELRMESLPVEVREASGMPRDRSATADDANLSGTKKKIRTLENKVRKLQDQLRGQRRRIRTSRTITNRQYKRLVAKTGGRVGNHRGNKRTTCQVNVPIKEEARVREDKPADVPREPMMPVKQAVKEKEKLVKSEPVAISLL
ncbi:hypothetical protein QBC45DRAFT_328138 [Copromyces sp. CBS 386.78]|nr:hypothetical protein QBC45DRAFT_328138 [Copromyces sp. CBS 386.78]